MAAVNVYPAEQIAILAATDTLTKERMAVENIILTGTAAGSFVLVLGNVTLTITTGANDLSKIVPVNRSLNYVALTSGPTGAAAIVMLEKKR